MIDLCAIGDLKWLMQLSVPRFPVQGEMTPITGIKRLLGNDAAVVSLCAARLGMRCRLLPTNTIARHDGQPLINLLQREKIDVSSINAEGVVTPTTFFLSLVSSDERAWLVEDCPFHYIKAFDEPPDYTFGYLDVYEEHIEKRLALLQKWSEAEVRCLVNLSSSRFTEKVRLLAPFSSIDTVQVRGSGDIDEAYTWGRHVLQTCNAKAAVITAGSTGAVVVDQRGEHFIAAEPIQPLRTLGAGANFSAGFLFALNNGATHQDAALFASKHAASFCTSSENPLEVIRV
jgi:sugar/nucleoside kinase (ribokinase family)